ncbi:HIT family protein [Idiomarina sp. HP20-50]|uniref:HIT family protein n=1 Tax=Idiomarina sp. HP20-50 TaxID=3070813 RepID=UPI00294AA605|nr:HIT family protein [Idiomarina sp. HP20-50]MDV6315215.1 HIT family protein [Idiomarina sp. HP20-50]
MEFKLATELARDSYHLTDWPLCEVRVMNDRQFPWFLLIPKIPDVREIIDLTEEQQLQLLRESRFLSQWLKAEYQPDKLNIAALGNQVPQLHVHHLARFQTDVAWPAPVWGKQPMHPLDENEVARLQSLFAEITF